MSEAPSRVACLGCRQRHLKCDAKEPTCSRCSSQNLECIYAGSRRGYRGVKRSHSALENVALVSNANGYLSSPSVESTTPSQATQSIRATPSEELPIQGAEVKLYYSHFHPSHPILPPITYLNQLPDFLVSVMKFVGAHYIYKRPSESVVHSLGSQGPSAFVVQAMTIMAVAMHARNQQEQAVSLLDDAVSLALTLGMTESHHLSQGDPILEESFRRTWWELCVVDGLISAIHRRSALRTNVDLTMISLPCEDKYLERSLPQPGFAQFKDRYFNSSVIPFSSACYRIEAVQILGDVLSLAALDDEDRFSTVDANLSCWHHHLPDSKRELLDPSGNIDEMLFQAYMIIHFATILLHLSRSHLHIARSGRVQCTPNITAAPATFTPHVHTVRVVKAANEISRMASLPIEPHRHTPFWICSLVLSAIVQLSACCANGSCKGLQPHRHRIIQTIGMLRSLARVWPMAAYTLEQVRAVANEIMTTEGGWAQPIGTPCDLDLANNARLLDNATFNADLTDMLMGNEALFEPQHLLPVETPHNGM